MNVSDYIFDFLKDKTDIVYLVTGGQAMHLNDALLRSKMKYIACHHEQACGMAADAYSRLSGKIGVGRGTAGPGGANVINGVLGGFLDSSPMLILSGQWKLDTVKYTQKTGMRQYGIQGINVEPIVFSFTKYFKMLEKPKDIKKVLKEAYEAAMTPRQGPAWIDFPLDVQGEKI